MELKVKADFYKITPNGNITLLLTYEGDDKRGVMDKLDQLLKKLQSANKGLQLTIDRWREKRSKNSNDYAWELLGKLAEKSKLPAVDIYRKYVYELQIKRQVRVDLAAANTLIKVWQKQGIAWLAEKVDEENGFARVDLYYGSSVYNTKQMYALIQSIIADCQAVGIETKTPEELAKLKGLTEGK